MKTLKALSALLAYPTAELQQAIPDVRELLAHEGVLDTQARAALAPLLDRLAGADIYEAQETYILLFDRSRSLSLHLFEHVHGESRDRGQAMVDLLQVYEEAGFTIAANELPDFVPLFLEYCATRPSGEACALLSQPAHIFISLGERLQKRGSDYAPVFTILAALASEKPQPEAFEAIVPDGEEDPQDLEALDAIWEEEEVLFGPGAANEECGIDGLAAKLRQARRPAPGLETPAMSGPRTEIVHRQRDPSAGPAAR